MVLGPVVLLLLAEGCLRLFGYGYPVTFLIRKPDGVLITNQKFAWQYFSKKTVLKPFLFTLPSQKPPGTLRICILGESAAMGTPDPAFSFGRILEVMVRREYPDRSVDVMNAAMRGINSCVIRRIAQDCAQHQVDVFVVYMGNNEVVGIHAPNPGAPSWTQSLTLLRIGDWAKRTRLGQLLTGALQSALEKGSQDMAYFRAHSLPADDPLREKNRDNFRANLEDILETARVTGAKVILSTVAVNLRDFAPLASLHRPNLSANERAKWDAAADAGAELERTGRVDQAIAKYLEAAQIDDHFAELHYRLGRCYWSKRDWAPGRQQFVLARDWDAMQFRTDDRMNQIIREAAQAHKQDGVALLDSERNFAESELSDHEVPGEKLFYEHVHPTFAGNYVLARGVFDAVRKLLPAQLPPKRTQALPTVQECADDLAYTLYDDVNANAAIVRLTSGPPFMDQLDHAQRNATAQAANQERLNSFRAPEAQRSLDTYLAALRKRPEDWPIHFNLALFCQELKRNDQAAEQFDYLVRRFPEVKSFRVGLANALLSTGNKAGALAQFQAALRQDPDDQDLQGQVKMLQPENTGP